jgi:hypothetical protein
MRKKFAAVVVGGLAATGLALVTAAPASALAPHVSVSVSSAYNYPDSYGNVQHYDKFSTGKYTYGNWAPKGARSSQAACYTGVVAYNYNFKA